MRNLFLQTVVTVFLLSGLLLGVQGDDNHGIAFQYPPNDLTVNFQDSINVAYTSNFTSPQLLTFCNPPGSRTVLTKLVQTDIPPFNGTSLVAIKWQNISACWFDLRPGTAAGQGANSPTFTVLESARATPSTFALSSATTIPSATATTSTTTASAATATSSASPSTETTHSDGAPTPPPSRLHLSLIISISIVSVLLLLVIAVGTWFWWKRRDRRGFRGISSSRTDASLLQPQYIDQRDQRWHPGGGGAAGEYVYIKPMQSYGDIREAHTAKGRPSELMSTEAVVELDTWSSPSPDQTDRLYEMGSREQHPVVQQPPGGDNRESRGHNRFSWEPVHTS